jgi:RNA polymerase sigma factor (sigma-70 family)
MGVHQPEPGALDAALSRERARLVRLCARLTGEWSVAEDLAQETLLEAWRARAKLRDADGLAPWLTAIARNVCLRWARLRGRDLAHHGSRADRVADWARPPALALAELPDAGQEVALALEREDLVRVLDRALALLPADTRQALVGSYVHELPQAELAARLGLSEGALRVRLHRGRLALRQALATDLREDAASLGVVLADADLPAWHETRIWCPFCGRYRLKLWIDRATKSYAFHCAGPCSPHMAVIGTGRNSALLDELSSPKSILARLCLVLATSYRQALAEAAVFACPRCGRPLPIQHWTPEMDVPAPEWLHGIHVGCPACAVIWDNATPWHLTIDTLAAIRFWRRHPRMRALPTRAIELEGRDALVTGLESVDDGARLEIISARDTYAALRIYGDEAR